MEDKVQVKLPKTVLISGVEYQVKQETNVMDAKGLMGESDCGKQEITIKPTIGPTKQIQTLIHEILHCLVHECGLPEKYQEHDLIDPLSNGFFRLLQDNDFSFVREK